eukprot:4457531-Amphidinium_carterae.1
MGAMQCHRNDSSIVLEWLARAVVVYVESVLCLVQVDCSFESNVNQSPSIVRITVHQTKIQLTCPPKPAIRCPTQYA